MNISIKQIENDLISFLKKGNPVVAKIKDIPKNDSLVELGYIDSFGIIDLIFWKLVLLNYILYQIELDEQIFL